MKKHNIIAEFSCSLNSDGTFKKYTVVNGSTFNEEYNETLDSATIVLSQVSKEDRLSNIKPYDYVRVYDASSTYNASTGKYDFDKLYLVDNFNEQENNIKQHIFGYTINLMSETKWLEKIQCPNLTITHKVNEDGTTTKKTIYQHIKQYMELFVPKIKFASNEVLHYTVDGDTNITSPNGFSQDGNRWKTHVFSQSLPNTFDTARVKNVKATFTNVSGTELTYDELVYDFDVQERCIILWVYKNDDPSEEPGVTSVKFDYDVVPMWSYQPLISVPESVVTQSDTSIIGLDADDFRQFVDKYLVQVYSQTLDESIDISTVSVSDTRAFFPGVTFETTNVTVDTVNRKFIFVGVSSDPPPHDHVLQGSVLIDYTYAIGGEFFKKFNVPCADLAFTAPTLRQLLTTLMQQVGCIPTVHNRMLGFLDFQADAQKFGGNKGYDVNDTVNFIRRGLSSDSYANTLVNISDTVLDSGNEVICETLCFRDKNSVLLKQKENLFLETSLPIYKVNKCILYAPGRCRGYLGSNLNCWAGSKEPEGPILPNDTFSTYKWPMIFYDEAKIENNTASLKIRISEEIDNPHVLVSNINVIFWSRDSYGYHIVSTKSIDEFELSETTMVHDDSLEYYDIFDETYTINTLSYTLTLGNNLSSSVVGFVISGVFTNGVSTEGNPNEQKEFTFIKFDDNDTNVEYHNMYSDGWVGDTWIENRWGSDTDKKAARYSMTSLIGFLSWDITKLVVENSIRNLLSRDFTKMNEEMPADDTSSWTIDNLAKYVYGTVGYSIGSNKIEGFSEVFNVGQSTALGWLQKDYTYIENIVNFVENSGANLTPIETIVYDYFDGFGYDYIAKHLTNPVFEYYDIENNDFSSGKKFFTGFWVDLYYQPLNSFNLSYVKSIEDIDIPITQYDSNASGLTDFDRLSIHEQEQVDRIGNETLSISQRTENFSDVQNFNNGPLYFLDDTNRDGSVDTDDKGVKYIIFKHSFTINNNCFNASYVGSKDSILKNYFTSIRTKYRAYQYVDYNNSVLRKERDTFYVRISKDYYNGDDRIWLGNYNQKNTTKISNWIYDFSNTTGQNENISYECEHGVGIENTTVGTMTTQIEQEQTIKNSISAISTQNMLGLIYEYIDNVGAGPCLKTDIQNNDNLGGVPQSWQIWNDDYNLAHTVTFVNYISYYEYTKMNGTATEIKNQIKKIEEAPIVDSSFIDLFTSPNVIFSIVDDNTVTAGDYTKLQRTFYKDYAERINHSTQFIYYAPNNDVLFNENFISGAPLISRFTNRFTSIYGSTDFSIDENEHDANSDTDTLLVDGLEQENIVVAITVANMTNTEIIDFNLTPTNSKYFCTFEYQLSTDAYLASITDVTDVTNVASNISSKVLKEGNLLKVKITAEITTLTNVLLATFTVSLICNRIVPNFYSNYVSKGSNYINIKWHGYNVIKLCSKTLSGKLIDIAVFKRTQGGSSLESNFYFMINDTKTDYVLSEKNGILYKKYIVSKNTDFRSVETIYDEED